MRIFAHELFAGFKETLLAHFSDRKSRNWILRNDFQKNAVKIWEQISLFEGMSLFGNLQGYVMNLWVAFSQMILMEALLTLLVGLCLKQHLRDQTVECLPWVLTLIAGCTLIIFAYKYYAHEKTQMFDNVKDLLKGSVEADIHELQDAYLHFKSTPDVRIIKVKENLDALQCVVVYYVYNEMIIGEMTFRYRKYSPKYHAT